jgi:predicted nucleic acid-binding protein
MAEYIVDASVVAEYLVTGQFTPNAIAFMRQSAKIDKLVVPEFTVIECTNVLWKHVRFQGLPKAQALQLLTDLYRLPLDRRPTKHLIRRSLMIGLDNALAIYDCVYIAMALKLNMPLITLDQRQEKAARAEGVIIKPITDFKS